MTKPEIWELVKTGVIILYGVLGLLAAFEPLAEYRQTLLLLAGIVSIAAGAFGVQLTRVTEQISDIKERKADEKIAAQAAAK